MTSETTPTAIILRLVELFEGTGFDPLGLQSALNFIEKGEDSGELSQFSTYFQRLFRYHDFCALELSDLIGEGGKGTEHIAVEMRRHEALSGAYRMAGLAVDSMNSANGINRIIPAVIEDEFAAIWTGVLIVHWAFASRAEREAVLQNHLTGDVADPSEMEKLVIASPSQVLAPMGEISTALEDLAESIPHRGPIFGRSIYPPLHPAAEMDRMADDDEIVFLRDRDRR